MTNRTTFTRASATGNLQSLVTNYNANLDALEVELENSLSRKDNILPNSMEDELDMNGNDIINVNEIDVSAITINGTPVQPFAGVTVASAFQSYTFTATLGQTSFSIAPFTAYVASVQVEVNGLSLPPADISVSGTNVIIPACTAGDEVVIRRYTSAPSPFPSADDITYMPAGTINTRSVQNKLREAVSVKDFGAVGDGVADDTVAIQAALNTDMPLDWGGFTYRITAPLFRSASKDIFWHGRNATIVYDGAHTTRAIALLGGGIDIVLNDITIDGGKLCNTCLEIDNNTDNYSNLTCNNLFVTRAKRINTFSGGAGLLVRGSYNIVSINGGGVSNCELPAGQGTSGSIGIAGISVTWYSTTRYVKAMYVYGAKIEKIYSSDLSYQDDQDGIIYFSPTDGATKIESLFSCINSEFVNCYGRSIKTQCRDTVVQASSFTRTEGLTSGRGNGEIDAQTGVVSCRDLTFSYSNGQQPEVCIGGGGGIGAGKPGLLVDGCSVYLDGVTLKNFTRCFPRDGFFSRHSITNNKVFGTVEVFFDFLCNGDKNYAEVSNNYVAEIADGSTSEKALIYVKASGATSPFYADTTAYGNVYDGAGTAAIVRDSMPSVGMSSNLSAWGNYGFANTLSPRLADNGLKSNQAARFAKIAGNSGNGYFNIISKAIASGATEVFDVSNVSGCILFIQAEYSNTAYALIGSSGSANAVIAKGTPFEVSNTTEPVTGVFRVWSSGTRQISIKNTDANARTVALFVMAPV